MSVSIRVNDLGVTVESLDNVVGHAIIAVIKQDDGGLTVERILGVNADIETDSQVVGDFIKQADQKLGELFPEEQPAPKIWTPDV